MIKIKVENVAELKLGGLYQRNVTYFIVERREPTPPEWGEEGY